MLLTLCCTLQGKDPGQEDQRAYWACEALKEQGQFPAARQSQRGPEDGGQAERQLDRAEETGETLSPIQWHLYISHESVLKKLIFKKAVIYDPL